MHPGTLFERRSLSLGVCFRSDLTGVLDGQAIFWNVRRQV
jgi:hypothetical protein